MVFPPTYSHPIVFSPTTHRGIGSISLRIEQEIIIINEIIRKIRTPEYGQDIFRIFLQTFQHALDLSKPLPEYPDQCASHLEGHCFAYLSEFLAENKMQMEFACVNFSKLERENNHFLMDEACAKTKE